MITWTLIVFLVFSGSSNPPTPLNIPGFTTTDACNEAATMAQAAAVKAQASVTVSTVCLPSRSQ